MSATEDDTELRDLLIQNLENNGVLNKLKAEMRAAVFLAMEEQDKLENKTPLINENLKKCLNTKDGRLVASLIMDFLQVFNLDFSLAVFQPEINWLNGVDSRELVCRDLGLSESEVNRKSPLLLELVRRGRHKLTEGDRSGNILKEPSQRQISLARKKFDFYDKDGSGSVLREDLKNIFMDLFPSLNKNMLERFIGDELRAADRSFSKAVDFQLFMGCYRRLFSQCCSVVVQDSDVSHLPEEKISGSPVSQIPRYKGGQSQTAAKDSGGVASVGKGDLQQQGSRHSEASDHKKEHLDLNLEVEDNPEDGDSFFDDPLPKPQKTYGCVVPLREECLSGPVVSSMRRGKSLSDLSVLAADSEDEGDDGLSEHSQSSELRKVEATGARGSPAGSLSEAPRPGGGGGGSSASEQSHSRNGALNSRQRGFRDSKAPNDQTGSLHIDDDVEYDDDFNSHRSDLSKSELSIGEEIEEVSIEGPDNSDKFDETTQDLSVSQLSQSHGADYMEDVA
ncbi:FGFR1 oncogene partner isoform X3 [Epinephelus fuscoguttatus]|uniref:FGFR1 oncogene partner isoform X3 n=1 Tax=Epinephelus fuscoguttatus TaxID=293821 RepID=UPI0020D11940|nr:FGFR1 oncogene partner isoform X3 [Epinephelus fuscoguttatus]